MKSSRAILACTVLARAAAGTTLHVPGDYGTIQSAIDVAVEGDTVLVEPGTYGGSGSGALDFRGVDLVLRSSRGAESTVVVADEDGRVVDLRSGEGAAARIEALTLRGTSGSRHSAVFCFRSSPTIADCVVEGANSAAVELYDADSALLRCTIRDNAGPGVECDYSSPTLVDCVIAGQYRSGGVRSRHSAPSLSRCSIADNRNGVSVGGGIYSWNSSTRIANCVISGNYTDDYAGGLYLTESDIDCLNTLFTGNSAPFGGGAIYTVETTGRFENRTITGNESDRGAGIYVRFEPVPSITNCIFWGNDTGEIFRSPGSPPTSYSCVRGGWPGEGNIDADPRFRSYQGFDLLLGPHSPGVDAGDPRLEDSIHDADSRWPWDAWYDNGPRSDMGAFGGVGNRAWLPYDPIRLVRQAAGVHGE